MPPFYGGGGITKLVATWSRRWKEKKCIQRQQQAHRALRKFVDRRAWRARRRVCVSDRPVASTTSFWPPAYGCRAGRRFTAREIRQLLCLPTDHITFYLSRNSRLAEKVVRLLRYQHRGQNKRVRDKKVSYRKQITCQHSCQNVLAPETPAPGSGAWYPKNFPLISAIVVNRQAIYAVFFEILSCSVFGSWKDLSSHCK